MEWVLCQGDASWAAVPELCPHHGDLDPHGDGTPNSGAMRDVPAPGAQPGPAELPSHFPPRQRKGPLSRAQTKAVLCHCPFVCPFPLPAPHPSLQPRQRLNFNTLIPGWAGSRLLRWGKRSRSGRTLPAWLSLPCLSLQLPGCWVLPFQQESVLPGHWEGPSAPFGHGAAPAAAGLGDVQPDVQPHPSPGQC